MVINMKIGSEKSVIMGTNVSFSYPDSKVLVLNNLSIEVKKGDILGLVGENGSGKSTLLKALIGYNKVDNLFVLGEKPYWDSREQKQRISYIPENGGGIPFFTGLQLIQFVLSSCDKYYDPIKSARVCELFGITNGILNDMIKNYSFGTKKKIQIISELLCEKELYILDEPTNGMDIYAIAQLREIIVRLNQNSDSSFIISSHDLNFISSVCNKVAILNEGKICEICEPKSVKQLEKDYLSIVSRCIPTTGEE